MEKERLEKLLTKVNSTEKVELTVLANAEVNNLKAFQGKSSKENLENWQKAKKATEELVVSLEEKYGLSDPVPQVFRTKKEVWKYLQEQGWKISESGFYKHCKQNWLLPTDGVYTKKKVDKYASDKLNTKATGKKVNDELEAKNSRKIDAEIRKTEAQAAKAEHDLEVAQGKYVLKEDLLLELVARAGVFDAALKYFIQLNVPEWIRIVGGDMSKVADIIQMAEDGIDQVLSELVRVEEHKVEFDYKGEEASV
jgi:hypothetical protein